MRVYRKDRGNLSDTGRFLFVAFGGGEITSVELLRAYDEDAEQAAKSRALVRGAESFQLYRLAGDGDDVTFERVRLDEPRHKLHFGPYKTPNVRAGQFVECARLGPVQIVGWSTGRIRWPIGKSGRKRSLVLFGGLERALRNESGPAIMEWWGFSQNTLWELRKALGVTSQTEGLRRLRAAHAARPWFKEMQRKAWAKARDPERIAKIAASKRGKPRPPGLMEALRKANVGRKHTAEARAKMSATRKRLGIRPPKAGRPWTAEEDAIVRRYPIADVMRLTGRTMPAVQSRRRVLRLPDRRATRNLVLG